MARPSAKVAITATALSAICVVLAGITWPDGQGGTAASDAKSTRTGAAEERSTPRAENFVLGNGLQVVAIPVANTKETVLMVWYRVGAADDPQNKPGLAHYVEHATFSALGSHGAESDAKSRRRDGRVKSGPGAFTSHDYTAYYHVTTKAGLSGALRREAERMGNLRIDEAAVDAERQAVFDERKHDVESDPQALLEERLGATAFSGTPYGRPVVGQQTDTSRVSAEDVRAFLDRWYLPDNAVLIVAGDVDSATLRELVETYFANVNGRPAPKRERPPPTEPARRRVSLQSDVEPHMLWARTYVAPSFSTADPREVLSLQLLARILAHHDAGRLNRALGADRKIAEEVAVEYAPEAVGATAFTIHATLVPNVDVAEFERLIENELAELVSKRVSEDELANARKDALAEFAERWSDPFEAANLVGAALATGQDLSAVLRRRQLISDIQPQHIRDAAQEIFAGNNGVTGMVRASGN